MSPFRNLDIKRKLLVMGLIKCAAVLLVAITALFVFQIFNFRSALERDTATLASIIANNSTAALAFEDTKAGAEVVGSLEAKPTVAAAYLVSSDGSLFAQFGKGANVKELPDFPRNREFRFTRGQLLYSQPVELEGKQIGTLFLRDDYRQTFLELIGFYGLVILGVVIISTGLALFLTDRMGRSITSPILSLVETAKYVGDNKDYSVRVATPTHTDELGRLMQTFNEMLEHIESQDKAIKESRDAEIRESREKLRSLIHSIDGIVWESTPDADFQFTFVSRQIERILGYSPEACLAHPGFWQEKLHAEDVARVTQTGYKMVSRPQTYSREYRILAVNGRWVWIRESGMVVMENNYPTAVRGIFQDITAQKLADEQLETMNRKLVETSRYAGMAEVATGVLHNVGNVLNSVSVSATLVNDQLRRSKVTNLHRATTMLREQNSHLVEFLTANPKGRLLPEYLCTVADELVGEKTAVIGEMTSVIHHIEHIKEIVAMQQSYAKVSGAYEHLSATELVEDALRMNAAAFERHLIQVVREFDEHLPPVCVDRHKVLQILINLLRNAKYAMDGQRVQDKRLVVQVAPASPDRVKITVCDNGVGIAPENLVNIFNHGFTTKKDGHGFGLHSGANAAKEMGGSLTVQSNGPGQGATFTLELPTLANTQGKKTSSKQDT